MRMLFDADLSVERLIPALSIESGTRITPEDTLVIFDEVQEVPRAMTSLKMFNEAAPEYNIFGHWIGAWHRHASWVFIPGWQGQ